MAEGCAQVLFFLIPFSDLNTYWAEDNILLMIKTVTFNHFSDFFNLLEVACGAQATQEYQSKIS